MSVDQQLQGLRIEGEGECSMEPVPGTKGECGSFTVQKLFQDPVGTINAIWESEYKEGDKNWYGSVIKRIETMVIASDWKTRAQLPCLNVMTADEIQMMQGRLIRFRGMVQETFEPQLYTPVVWIKHRETGEVNKKCFVFQTEFEISLDTDESDEHPEDLQVFDNVYVIPVPGENTWVTDLDKEFSEKANVNDAGPCGDSSSDTPHNCLKQGCYIKVFRSPMDIMVNDIVEFYGVLNVNFNSDNNGTATKCSNSWNEMTEVQERKSIEDSRPQLDLSMNVVGYLKDCGNNASYSKLALEKLDIKTVLNEASVLRGIFMDLMTDAFMGDDLCANYVTFNVFSQVCGRTEGTAVGPMAVHVTHVPPQFSDFINSFMKCLVEKSVYIKNVLRKSDTNQFTPRKNLENNRLMGSLLQVSCGTHVLLEEEKISPGIRSVLKSQENCKKNLKDLLRFIEDQVLPYSFGFSTEIDFNHDAPVLIFSGANRDKPVLIGPKITMVPLKPNFDQEEFENTIKPRINRILDDAVLMSKLRHFILLTKESNDFEIDDEMHELITKDFLRSRESNKPEARMGIDDLHSSLTLSRLWSKFHGKKMSIEIWNAVRLLETERKGRIIHVDSIQ